jgi:hypothetical protein
MAVQPRVYGTTAGVDAEGAGEGFEVAGGARGGGGGFGGGEAPGDAEFRGDVGVVGAREEFLEVAGLRFPVAGVALLLRGEAGAIPIAREDGVAREEGAEFRGVGAAAFPRAVAHDVQQGLERGTASSMEPSAK